VPSASVASRTRKPRPRTTRATSAGLTPVIAARSGSIGSKNGSGWATRMVEESRHSRGVRSSVHTTIEMASTTRAHRNWGDLKIEKAFSRSRTSTTPVPMTGS
jgi:hypothetical protein